MERLLNKEISDIVFEDLEFICDNKLPAHKGLHFLDGKDFKSNDSSHRKLSKLICALANSEGGIIIWGIKKLRGKAAELRPISSDFDTTVLKEKIISEINPFPEALELNKVMSSTGSYLLLQVGKSEKPLMFSDYRYYGLRDSKVVKLEASEVASLYHRKAETRLEIFSIYNTQGIPEMKDGKFKLVRFYPNILIRNAGEGMEKNYKLEVKIPAELYEENTYLTNHFSRHEGKYSVFSFEGRSIVFGGETRKMLEFTLKVSNENADLLETESLYLKLYYSDGIHEQNFRLEELLTYRGKVLKPKDFLELSM